MALVTKFPTYLSYKARPLTVASVSNLIQLGIASSQLREKRKEQDRALRPDEVDLSNFKANPGDKAYIQNKANKFMSLVDSTASSMNGYANLHKSPDYHKIQELQTELQYDMAVATINWETGQAMLKHSIDNGTAGDPYFDDRGEWKFIDTPEGKKIATQSDIMVEQFKSPVVKDGLLQQQKFIVPSKGSIYEELDDLLQGASSSETEGILWSDASNLPVAHQNALKTIIQIGGGTNIQNIDAVVGAIAQSGLSNKANQDAYRMFIKKNKEKIEKGEISMSDVDKKLFPEFQARLINQYAVSKAKYQLPTKTGKSDGEKGEIDFKGLGEFGKSWYMDPGKTNPAMSNVTRWWNDGTGMKVSHADVVTSGLSLSSQNKIYPKGVALSRLSNTFMIGRNNIDNDTEDLEAYVVKYKGTQYYPSVYDTETGHWRPARTPQEFSMSEIRPYDTLEVVSPEEALENPKLKYWISSDDRHNTGMAVERSQFGENSIFQWIKPELAHAKTGWWGRNEADEFKDALPKDGPGSDAKQMHVNSSININANRGHVLYEVTIPRDPSSKDEDEIGVSKYYSGYDAETYKDQIDRVKNAWMGLKKKVGNTTLEDLITVPE